MGASLGGAVKLNYNSADIVINWSGGLHQVSFLLIPMYYFLTDIVFNWSGGWHHAKKAEVASRVPEPAAHRFQQLLSCTLGTCLDSSLGVEGHSFLCKPLMVHACAACGQPGRCSAMDNSSIGMYTQW